MTYSQDTRLDLGRAAKLRRPLVTLMLLVAMAVTVAPPLPAEAATMVYTPRATCYNGYITVYTGVVVANSSDWVSVAYAVDRLNYNGTWSMVYSGYGNINFNFGFPPSASWQVPYKFGIATYRVRAAMVWHQNGIQKQWANTVVHYQAATGNWLNGCKMV